MLRQQNTTDAQTAKADMPFVKRQGMSCVFGDDVDQAAGAVAGHAPHDGERKANEEAGPEVFDKRILVIWKVHQAEPVVLHTKRDRRHSYHTHGL